ncbi:MAG: ABC-2 transporter permease [Actinobacteria bacterium]|nr:ABC-2 transporter permease [Actinomycetota bacterium]
MGQIYAILLNTLTETIRQPVYALLLTVSCGVIALTPVTAAQIYSFRVTSGLDLVAERMIADLGLATVLLSGLLLGIFTSTSVISREIDNRTAGTVLSTTVSRSTFVVGKYLGVAAGILLATSTCAVIMLLTIRAGAAVTAAELIDWGAAAAMAGAGLAAVIVATLRNYSAQKSWIGSFNLTFIALAGVLFVVFSVLDKEYRFVFAEITGQAGGAGITGRLTYDGEVIKAALLTIQAVLVMTSIAVVASTRLGTVGTAFVTGAVFLLGLTSESTYHLLVGLHWGRLWETFAGALHTAVPNLERFWVSDALTREIPIPGSYVLVTSAYTLVYVVAMLLVASFLMQNRDIS